MISLTFVRSSKGSHGTVGRTTLVSSGRYGFESQPSPTFLIITTENSETPPLLPPLIFKLFRSWKSSETQHTRVPLRFFSVLRDKKFSIENRDFTLLGIKFFDTRNLLKGSSTKCCDTVRQNNFDGKSWYPPPLLSPTFFDTRNFLKHRRVPLRSFSALWEI